MEGAMSLLPILRDRIGIAHLLFDLVKACVGRPHPRRPGVVTAFDRELQGGELHPLACLGDVAKVFARNGGDAKAALRLKDYQSIAGKLRQRVNPRRNMAPDLFGPCFALDRVHAPSRSSCPSTPEL